MSSFMMCHSFMNMFGVVSQTGTLRFISGYRPISCSVLFLCCVTIDSRTKGMSYVQ